MATLPNNPTLRGSVSFGSVVKAALTGAGIAAVGNLVLLFIAGAINIPLNVMAGPPGPGVQATPIMPIQVILSSLLPAIIGGLLYFALTKISAKGATIFTVIAIVVALASLLAVFGQPLTMPGMIVLILMHLFAAVAITWALTKRARA